MIEESKYLSGVMKRHFNTELVMTKEDKGNFKSSTKCCISENNYVDKDVKVRDQLSYQIYAFWLYMLLFSG